MAHKHAPPYLPAQWGHKPPSRSQTHMFAYECTCGETMIATLPPRFIKEIMSTPLAPASTKKGKK